MKRILLLLLLSSCVFSSKLFGQNGKSWPNSLLWRISGNGLSKNSFLYGTMHVQDKRLFYFSDSLYHYLGQADGYSMEIDIQEMMDSVIQKMLDERETDLIDNKRLNRTEDKKKIIDSLLQNVKKYNDKKSKKQLEKLRREKMNQAMRKEMPTIMDAYLYGIAKKKGKWVGGIEDVQDQLTLFDEFGSDVTDKELLAPDAELVTTLEKMIEIYLARDLNRIEQYIIKQVSDEVEDKMFTRRNIKMASRMDSLANIRSMFFAVGAAHLPGDSGVITLLRKKGYRVDPVFSSRQIDPIAYASNLTDLSWVKIEDDRKTYSVQMPGEAADLNMYENFIKMKFHLDITTMNVYMSGSVVSQRNLDFNKLLESVAGNTGTKVQGKKAIEYKGMKGIETIILTDGYYFKARYLLKENILYMLMVGGGTKASTETKDAQKFLQSFAASPVTTTPASQQWSTFEIKEKAMSVMLPGKPTRNSKLEKTAEGSGWNFTVYNYTDEALGMYYMVQVRDIEPGYYLTSDTAYFSLLKNNMGGTIQKVTKDSVFKIGNYPAFAYEGQSEDDRLIFKTLIVNRGNRSYTLYVGGANDTMVNKAMQYFIGSLSLSPYEKTLWKNVVVAEANFSTTAPSLFRIAKKKADNDEEVNESSAYYVSNNPNDCVSYQVYKEIQSPYYWTDSDSTFFKTAANDYKTNTDSVWSRRQVTNGKLKGMEWIIETPGTSNMKKMRQFLNGDTLYTLISFIPIWSIHDRDHQRFFDDFRVLNEIPDNSIFKSKAARLLHDLQSTDPEIFEQASKAVGDAQFGIEDRQLLVQAFLKQYPDEPAEGYSLQVRAHLEFSLLKIMDSSTINTLRDGYLKTDNELIRHAILELLASRYEGYSYTLLKDLLINHTPKTKAELNLSGLIWRSTKMARTLFPEILKLSNDKASVEMVAVTSLHALDSNLISLDMLTPYRKNFLYATDTILTNVVRSDESYNPYKYYALLELIRRFNDRESNQILRKYLDLDDLYLKQKAAVSLIKNDQPVDKKHLEAIAADYEFRNDLYEDLRQAGHVKIFPAKYLTQQHLAESILYDYASDNGEPDTISFIAAKTARYNGQAQRFYLFRVHYPADEESETGYEYMGVVGPYSTDLKNLQTDKRAISYQLTYDLKKMDEILAEHLKEIENK